MSLKLMRKRGKSGVRLSRSAGGTAAIFLFLIVIGVFMALPIVYSLVQSIKPMEEIFAYPPKFFVKNPTFDNYIQVYQLCQNLWVPLSRYVFNSLFISVLGTVVYVFIDEGLCPLFPVFFPDSRTEFQCIRKFFLQHSFCPGFCFHSLGIPKQVCLFFHHL